MLRNVVRIISFTVTIAIVIVVLKTLNWLPNVIQKDTLREYDSVEAVSTQLNIKEVFIPSYFPQSIQWPPVLLMAQKKPFTATLMAFEDRGSGEIILVIHQSRSGDFIPYEKIKMTQVSETVSYDLDGRKATLEVGSCDDDKQCSRILWLDRGHTLKLIMQAPPFELIKIAESMSH